MGESLGADRTAVPPALLGVSSLHVDTEVGQLLERPGASWNVAGERRLVLVDKLVDPEVAFGEEGLGADAADIRPDAGVDPLVDSEGHRVHVGLGARPAAVFLLACMEQQVPPHAVLVSEPLLANVAREHLAARRVAPHVGHQIALRQKQF